MMLGAFVLGKVVSVLAKVVPGTVHCPVGSAGRKEGPCGLVNKMSVYDLILSTQHKVIKGKGGLAGVWYSGYSTLCWI